MARNPYLARVENFKAPELSFSEMFIMYLKILLLLLYYILNKR